MRIAKRFAGYNPRRYGKPWIARITSWPVGGKPDIEWGTFVGDDEGGEVEILANVGDIVRVGQRDHRGSNTFANWYVVQEDGALQLVDAAAARKAYDEKMANSATSNPPNDLTALTDDELVAEIKRRGLEIVK
jgi:hypothetical protein